MKSEVDSPEVGTPDEDDEGDRGDFRLAVEREKKAERDREADLEDGCDEWCSIEVGKTRRT